MTYNTAVEALAAWDAGQIVTTVELGGLGPGYEQAIQVCAFEMIRDLIAADAVMSDENIAAIEAVTDATVRRIDKECGGFSGAQVGAARWLAFRTLRDGWEFVVAKAREKDQTTMVSRAWPNVPRPVVASHGPASTCAHEWITHLIALPTHTKPGRTVCQTCGLDKPSEQLSAHGPAQKEPK